MAITLEAKVQWFADQIHTQICALEDDIVRNYDALSEEQEYKLREKVEILESVYELIEDTFGEHLFKDEE